MKAWAIIAAGLGMAALSGCSSGPAPVEVTRFHLGTPIDRGTVTVEPFATTGPASLEFKTYAAAVESELLRVGYRVGPAGGSADYVASVNFLRASRGVLARQSPVSVGLGGGSYGRGLGLGAGISLPIGKRRPRDLIVSELSVQIKRRSDGTAIWEGRAQTEAADDQPGASASVAAPKLASALFKDFPGESGRTVLVK